MESLLEIIFKVKLSTNKLKEKLFLSGAYTPSQLFSSFEMYNISFLSLNSFNLIVYDFNRNIKVHLYSLL